jgi:hypothetical protein
VNKELRNLAGQSERVETGPIKFGEDWPGLFVRGCDCLPIASAIRVLISAVPWQKVIYDKTLFWAVGLLEDFCLFLEHKVIVRGVACFYKKSKGLEEHLAAKADKIKWEDKKYRTY